MTEICKRNTAAWRLFNLRFAVMIPHGAQYSAEYLKKNAVTVSGDRMVDSMRVSQLERTYMTAAGLAMIIDDGYAISILNIQDCVQIYHDIQEHLNDWCDQTTFSTNVNLFPPLKDFRALETLAIDVYEMAKRLEPREESRSQIFDALINLNRRRNLIATNRWLTHRAKTDDKFIPYVSIVDNIERYVVENG